MGYSITRFVVSVDANLLCSICSAVLEDPVLTPCGHSFCLLCLETWLDHSGASSCPECRGSIGGDETRPIRSVRNLINGLEMVCENRIRGCDAVMRVDAARAHLDTCRHGPVQCAGCTETVSRCELPQHHVKCAVIAAVLGDDDDEVDADDPGHEDTIGISRQVSELAFRVSSLELKLRRMKRELESAETQNKRLERELKKTRDELEQKRRLLLDTQYADFDPDYEYGYRPETVSKLSRFIARFLRHKPSYVSANRVFAAIKRCHDNFAAAMTASNGVGCQDDFHMLLATAFSSNWFNDEQRVKLRCWLQIMAHCLRYRPATTSVAASASKVVGHQDLRRLYITNSAAV